MESNSDLNHNNNMQGENYMDFDYDEDNWILNKNNTNFLHEIDEHYESSTQETNEVQYNQLHITEQPIQNDNPLNRENSWFNEESIRSISTNFTHKFKKRPCNNPSQNINEAENNILDLQNITGEIASISLFDNSSDDYTLTVKDPILFSKMDSEIYVREILNAYNNSLKNPFDISFYILQTLLLRSPFEIDSDLKDIFMSIRHMSIIKHKDEVIKKDSNFRKRSKTLINKVILKYINFFLHYFFKGEYQISSFGFTDPHKKNNIKSINQTIRQVISYEKQENLFLERLINKIQKGLVIIENFNNPISKLVLQFFLFFIDLNYADAFDFFYKSFVYEKVIFENIKKTHDREYALEFNYYAISFINYVKDIRYK